MRVLAESAISTSLINNMLSDSLCMKLSAGGGFSDMKLFTDNFQAVVFKLKTSLGRLERKVAERNAEDKQYQS